MLLFLRFMCLFFVYIVHTENRRKSNFSITVILHLLIHFEEKLCKKTKHLHGMVIGLLGYKVVLEYK